MRVRTHHKGTKITQRDTKEKPLFFVFLCVIFVPLWFLPSQFQC